MGEKPRVLIVTPDFPPALGGIQTLLHRLASHMSRIETHVVTSRALSGSPQNSEDAVRRMGPGSAPRSVAIGTLNAMIPVEAFRSRPDVLLSGHTITSPGALVASRLLRAPVVQYVHGHELAGRPRLAAFALRQADRSIAVSNHTRTLALSLGADPGKVVVIPPGVDVPDRPSAPFRAERPTIVTVARLIRRKGHDVMLRAIPLIRARVPDVEWLVIGDGPLRGELESGAAERRLNGCVRFLGSVDDELRDRCLDRAHVFAMPSRLPDKGGGEGFGIAYLEAGAHALPVVGGAEGGAVDAVLHGETGILVDPRDHVALASAIVDLLTDRDKAAALGDRGARRAREFSWPLTARRVEDTLLEVCESR